MFEPTKMQTTLRINEIETNQNISFPIGTIDLVTSLYEILNFSDIFGKYKKRDIDINKLLKALVNYKLMDNSSITRSHEWIRKPEGRDIFGLDQFNERIL